MLGTYSHFVIFRSLQLHSWNGVLFSLRNPEEQTSLQHFRGTQYVQL